MKAPGRLCVSRQVLCHRLDRYSLFSFWSKCLSRRCRSYGHFMRSIIWAGMLRQSDIRWLSTAFSLLWPKSSSRVIWRACSDLKSLALPHFPAPRLPRSEEHTSELQSLMRISYAVFCLKKKKIIIHNDHHRYNTSKNNRFELNSSYI